ncbi:MAG: translation initiation factor IF-2 subunit alpha [bacterium]|nr:translation initiation factor IF-2 subunit alpha [bacterium]
MLIRRLGFPEESELVLCTVTSVQSNSVFVTIDEYNLNGMIHISEVSPGRIRNMRDFVKEGKVVVCKVLRVNRERGQVDVSLRRVTDAQRRNKINEAKQQQKAEKILEFVANKLKKDTKDIYAECASKIESEYHSLFGCFMDVVEGNADLQKLGISKQVADEITDIIKQRMKPAEVCIKGKLVLTSYAPDGVEIVKDALKKAVDCGVAINYVGAGNYGVSVKAPNYKEAEKLMETATNKSIDFMKDNKGVGEFVRNEA